MYQSLAQLAEQDPLIGLRQDDRTQALYVSLYGEVQKEVIQETLATEFRVEAEFSASTIVHVERVVGVGVALDEAPDPFIRLFVPGMTRGGGFLETEFSHYAPVPGEFPTRPRTELNPLIRGDYLRQVT